MNWMEIGFQVFGGLGLFLMGMKFMSEGMQKVAGNKLRKVLGFLTANRFIAIFVGFFVTAIIQSSSATTVMTVGFVNAQLLSLNQAIGVILGANIGTTATAWIVSLHIVKYAMFIIGIGVLIRFVAKGDQLKYIGEIIFGFGILFLGMNTMSDGMAPLRNSPDFIAFFTKVDGHSYISILLGVFIGTATTVLVQSSSATIGIAIALASQGLLEFPGAVALILGDNIGTTITAILASIGTNYHAKRAALAHTMFNVLGVCIILAVFYPFVSMINSIIPMDADFTIKTAEDAAKYGMGIGAKPVIGQHIAMAHSMFNITNVIIFTPFISVLAFVVRKIIPEPKYKEKPGAVQFAHIHYGLIDTPAIGIIEAEKELAAMAERVRKNSKRIKEILTEKKDAELVAKKIEEDESMIDDYRKMITEFLLSLSQHNLSRDDAVKVGNYITCAHNLEKYADYISNTAGSYIKMKSENLTLSDIAKKTVDEITDAIELYYAETVAVFKNDVASVSEFLNNATLKKKDKNSKTRTFSETSRKDMQE